MATSSLTPSASSLTCKTRRTERFISSSFRSSLRFPYSMVSYSSISISHPHDSFASSMLGSTNKTRLSSALAVVQEEPIAAVENIGDGSPTEFKNRVRPCELYVCNLPRSCDISELLEMFKPYGTVHSVEVSRNVETGISRGCGFITMSSINDAKAAIAALDGSDVCGREMRVTLSVNMNPRRKNLEALDSAPKKNLIFESPHKVYVGNLAWSVKPEDLREHFSQFGTVVSTRVLHDRKAGRNRVYGFLSFSSAAEREIAISSSGAMFHGRTILVREVSRSET